MATESDMPSREPRMDRDAFDCPRCGVFAKQTWKTLYRHEGEGFTQLADRGFFGDHWKAAGCDHCHEWSIWRQEAMVFPTAATVAMPHPSMPGEAKNLYLEARSVLPVSRRAGAALARAALERLLRALDPNAPQRADLATRIDRVAARLPTSLVQMLTVIRVAGNSSLHVKDQPEDVLVLVLDTESVAVAELMFTALNELVDELVEKPSRAAELYSTLPESIRARVEKQASPD